MYRRIGFSFSILWVWLAACMLALAWLIPNHYQPWSSFHADAWSAFVFALVAGFAILFSRTTIRISRLVLLTLAATMIPLVQLALHQIESAGVAVISCMYLLGLHLAIVASGVWERNRPGFVLEWLSTAFILAAIISVGMQCMQWLHLGLLDIWSMGDGLGRPFANIGQPNQLATLLIWGLVAVFWKYDQGEIDGKIALLSSVYILIGIALTGSRTGWLGLLIVWVMLMYWRGQWSHKSLFWPSVGLVCLFITFVFIQTPIATFLLLQDGGGGEIARVAAELRPAIWRMFVDAAAEKLLSGYGWNQVGSAQLAEASNHPGFASVFSHSHNLFLDMVLWCGLPVASVLIIFIAHWFVVQFRNVTSSRDAVLIMFLFVVGNHAMLELPLHYAYFLLPVGFMLGVLDVRSKAVFGLELPATYAIAVWLVAVGLLATVVRDYSRVEDTYRALRFEWAGINSVHAQRPNTLLLTQWDEFYDMVRRDVGEGMSAQEIQKMESVTELFPSSGFMVKTALALALNDRGKDAALWLVRLCKVSSNNQCDAAKKYWLEQSKEHPSLAKVQLP